MATQAGAVRFGTPIRTSPIPWITSQAALLPHKYSLLEQRRQNEASMAEKKRQFGLSYGLAQEQQEEAERQARRSGQLGLGNLALSVGMGVEGLRGADAINSGLANVLNAAPDQAAAATSALKDTLSQGIGSSSPVSFTDFMGGNMGEGGVLGGLGGTFGTMAPWAGGAAGAVLGPKIGNLLPFGGETEKGILGGALAGGVTGYFAGGGDIYSALTGALLGGVGGGW